MDVMFEQGPESHNIFKRSKSASMCLLPGPDVGDDVVGLPAILIAMLLTILLNFGLEDVSDVPVDGECPTSSQLD